MKSTKQLTSATPQRLVMTELTHSEGCVAHTLLVISLDGKGLKLSEVVMSIKGWVAMQEQILGGTIPPAPKADIPEKPDNGGH